MEVIIKSKKEVLVDALSNVRANPECELKFFYLYDGKYKAAGEYYYTYNGDRILIKEFGKEFTTEEIDQLFKSLSITYPDNSTYSEMDYINRMAGLKYIVSSEGRFGLSVNDWE